MKSSPLISICIPTYNRTRYLKQALISCFRQTYKNYEIIICDNSTNSNSQRFIRRIKNPHIRYYKNKTNLGSVKNINQTLSFARGKYIKFLFDDDLLCPNCLEEMVTVLEKNKTAGIAMAPLDIIDNHGKNIQPRFHYIRKMRELYRYQNHSGLIRNLVILKDFLIRTYPCCVPTGIMVRKQCIDELGKFDEDFNYIGDLEFCIRMSTKYDFYYVNQKLSAWRYTESSETVNILHTQTISPVYFYRLIDKFYYKLNVARFFPKKDREKIIMDAYIFASKRAMLNSLVALKFFDIKLLLFTIKTVYKSDPFVINRIKLPFSLFKEFIIALYNLVKL